MLTAWNPAVRSIRRRDGFQSWTSRSSSPGATAAITAGNAFPGDSPVRPERTRFGKNFTVWICGLYHRPKPFPSGCRSGSFITGTGRRPTLRKDWSTSGAIRPFSTAAICSQTITASRSGTSSCLPNTAGGTWSTNPAAPRNRGATGSSFPRRRANTAITSCCTGSESPRPASSPSGKAAAFST